MSSHYYYICTSISERALQKNTGVPQMSYHNSCSEFSSAAISRDAHLPCTHDCRIKIKTLDDLSICITGVQILID